MDWGVLIRETLRLYQRAAKETAEKVGRAWWVGLLPLVYAPVFFLAANFVAPFGLAGGLILGLFLALCTGSYIYFIAGAVQGNRLNLLRDLGESWRPYFGPVITILFFLMLVRYTLVFLPPGPATQALQVMVTLLLPIFLSPIPEIIYQGRSDGFGMLQESVEFLRESGVEWFIPLSLLCFGLSVLMTLPFVSLAETLFFPLPDLILPLQLRRASFLVFGSPFWSSLDTLIRAALSALLVFVLMVFRGLLFHALSGSSRRQRIFRSRFE